MSPDLSRTDGLTFIRPKLPNCRRRRPKDVPNKLFQNTSQCHQSQTFSLPSFDPSKSCFAPLAFAFSFLFFVWKRSRRKKDATNIPEEWLLRAPSALFPHLFSQNQWALPFRQKTIRSLSIDLRTSEERLWDGSSREIAQVPTVERICMFPAGNVAATKP